MKNDSQRSLLYVGCAFCIALGWAVIAPLGCSSNGGTGGAAGAAGNPGDASSSVCGGIASLRCTDPNTTFCDYPDQMACGAGDATGVCTPRPDSCSKDCPGVCGCDGKRYCNACEANRAGIDVQPMGTCQ